MLHTNGEVRVSCNGKPYLLKFGMVAARMAESHPAPSESEFDLLGHIFWVGLMSRAAENGLPDTFSHHDALEFIDGISDDDLVAVLATQKAAFERLPNVARRVADVFANPAPPSPPTGKKSSK